jgi:uroporphyrin-III C-methyltransferase
MGKVYIVGSGPGDPDLLTLKAYRVLREAQAVLYDALVTEEVLRVIPRDCLKIYVGKRPGRHSMSQEEINALLLKLSKVYRRVVRLKGGDPFVFGRGGEELLYLLSRGVEVEVVPGLSSALAAPSSALIPVTHRGVSSSFAVVRGHPSDGVNWRDLARVDTLLVLMGVKNRRRIARELIEAGRDPSEPVAFVERATTPQERVLFSSLGEVAENPPEVYAPAVMIVGRVVHLGREALIYKDLIAHPEGLSRLTLGDRGVEA